MLFARALAERVAAQGQPVRVVSCHPGCIATELQRDTGLPKALVAPVMPFASPLLKSIPQGAATQVYTCVSALRVCVGNGGVGWVGLLASIMLLASLPLNLIPQGTAK